MTRRLLLPTPERPVILNRAGPDQIMVALVAAEPPTVGEMVALLAKGREVLCRIGSRGMLTGELKRLGIMTRSRTVSGGVLFQPCAKREFK